MDMDGRNRNDSAVTGTKLRAGISRITEGYKLQPYSLIRGVRVQEPGTKPTDPRAKPGSAKKPRSKEKIPANAGGGDQVSSSADNRTTESSSDNHQPAPIHEQQPRNTEDLHSANGLGSEGDGFIESLDPAFREDNEPLEAAHDIQGNGTTPDKHRADEERGSGLVNYLTIYEEEQAIPCLAWCPAVECGGWAAAGMGSGLLRVEDIAI